MFATAQRAQPASNSVWTAGVDARAAFLQKTYGHLLGAVLAFTLIEVALFRLGYAEPIALFMLRFPWLIWLGAFMFVGFLATKFAISDASRGAQYAGLMIYVLAEAFIFVPLLWFANSYADGVIANAAVVTVAGFAALTAIVFVTRKDFSFLRSVLIWGGMAALGFIVIGSLAGWTGGTVFPVLMIAFAGAYVLYETSNVMLHYPEDKYVGAALGLFAAVALMFWYVIALFLNGRD